MHHHWVGGAAAAVVVADTLVEGEDVGGVVWHPVVGPRQEVELLDMACRVLIPILHRVWVGQGAGGVTDYTSSHLDTQTHLLYRELAHTVHCKLLLLRHGDLDVAIETGDIDRFWPVLVAFDNALRNRQGEGEGEGRERGQCDRHTYRQTYLL